MKKIGQPVERLAKNRKIQNSNFEIKNHKNLLKQLTLSHECFMTTDHSDQKRKQLDNGTEKQLPLQPVLFGCLRVSRANQELEVKTIRILIDSGASATIISNDMTKNLPTLSGKPINWITPAGNFQTNPTVLMEFTLPEFHTKN